MLYSPPGRLRQPAKATSKYQHKLLNLQQFQRKRKNDANTAPQAPAVSRRSLRSATNSRSEIPIPATLPANGATSGRRVKRVKREHEDASDDSMVLEDSSRTAWLGDWVVYAQLYDAQRGISNGPPFWATTYATGWKAEGSAFKLLPDGSGELVTEKVGNFSVKALNGTVRYANGSFEWHASEEFRSEWVKWRDVWMPLEIDWLESDPPDRDWGGPMDDQERPARVLAPGLRLRARLPCIPTFLDGQLDEGGIYEGGPSPFEEDGTKYSSFREYVEKGCPWQAELYLCRPSDYSSAAAANKDLMKGFLLGG